MPKKNVTTDIPALFIFVDIIDSSRISSYTSIAGYAELLLEIEEIFNYLAGQYFPDPAKPSEGYADKTVRGDEGIVFYYSKRTKPGDLIYNAIKFVMELKARIRLEVPGVENVSGKTPKPISIAAGIHYGKIAVISEPGKDRPSGLSGYNINYAKRVESSSRRGKYSKVFLSKAAASMLSQYPIILEKHSVSLRGIEEVEDVFEVRSAQLSPMPHNINQIDTDDKFLKKYGNFNDAESFWSDFIDEPWLKSIVASTLHSAVNNESLREAYDSHYSRLIWHDPLEDDPIILSKQGEDCKREEKYTRMLTCYKNLVEKFPNFIEARKQLAEACWLVTNNNPKPAEWVLARDTADEFLSRYPGMLSSEETKILSKILEEANRVGRTETGETDG